jgi:hypothetical protein
VLFLADSLATVGADALLPRWPAYVEHVRVILRWHPPPSAERIRGVVDGHHLMKELGLTPGPVVGRLLAAIDEAANAGEIESPNDATDLARKLLQEWGTS